MFRASTSNSGKSSSTRFEYEYLLVTTLIMTWPNLGDAETKRLEGEYLANLTRIHTNLTAEVAKYNREAEQYQNALRSAKETIVKALEELITKSANEFCEKVAKDALAEKKDKLACSTFKSKGSVCESCVDDVVQDLEFFDNFFKVWNL